jgi:hypothetical protein
MSIMENANRPDLRYANFTEIGGNQYNFYSTTYSSEEKTILAALKPAVRVEYHPGCMEGTRESIFNEIDTWLDEFGTSRIR